MSAALGRRGQMEVTPKRPLSELEYYSRRALSFGASYANAVVPFTGECLEDLLVRAACENGFGPYACYRLLGVKGLSNGASRVPGTSSDLGITSENLSILLGNPGGPEELEHLLTRRQAPEPGLRQFFDVWLQYKTLCRWRRVSPRALRNKPFLRAMWKVSPLAFDIETKEYLLSTCPECGLTLGGGFMGDIWCCDRCAKITDDGDLRAVDLREYPQEIVKEELWENLDFATGLIDPTKGDARSALRSRLDSVFDNMHAGAIFDLIYALGRYVTAIWGHEFSVVLSPSALALAAEVVRKWPDGFNLLLSSTNDVRTLKLQPLDNVLRDRRIPRPLRDKMKELARAHLIRELATDVPAKQLIESARNFRTFGPIRKLQLQNLKNNKSTLANDISYLELRHRPSVRACLRLTGIALPTLMDMVDAEALSASIVNDDGGLAVLEDLIMNLTKCAQGSQPPETAIRLPRAVSVFFARGGDPWRSVLNAMLARRIEYWKIDSARNFIEGVFVRDIFALRELLTTCVTGKMHLTASLRKSETCTWTRLRTEDIAAVTRSRLLTPPHTILSLDAFRAKYELTSAIRLRLQCAGHSFSGLEINAVLRNAGSSPLLELSRSGEAVWKRSDVEDSLRDLAMPCVW